MRAIPPGAGYPDNYLKNGIYRYGPVSRDIVGIAVDR
jgi:hypothetical protein